MDSIELVENDKEMSVLWVVGLLRSICDEVSTGELGEWLDFKYVLIHNGNSSFGMDNTPTERHIWSYQPEEEDD